MLDGFKITQAKGSSICSVYEEIKVAAECIKQHHNPNIGSLTLIFTIYGSLR